MSGDVVLLGRLARLHRATLSLLGFKSATRRIGEIELTAEEAQKLGQIAAGSTRQYTFPARIERMFQNYVRESSRAARISLVMMTAVVYLTIPLWVSVLGLPKQSQELMTIASLGLITPLFAIVTFVQVRYLASGFAEASISVLVPVAVIAMARLRISLNFLFIAIYFQVLAFEPFWWTQSAQIDYAMAWGVNLLLLSLLLLAVFFMKMPLQKPGQLRLRNAYNIALVALYFWVLIYEAMRWPDEIGTRGPTGWLLEVLLLTIVMMAAVWSKLSSRRQWAANVLLQLMAYRDSLTGLPNRRAFEDHYERVTRALARSEKKQLVLAVLDLDHFKRLNDDYGHDYGDGALAEVALTLAQFARRSLDMSARLGGEEFALLLYDCDAESARLRLAELVQVIAEMKIENRNTDRGVLTCSIGAAVVGPNELFGTAYRTADELLYQVKNAGRNNFALAN